MFKLFLGLFLFTFATCDTLFFQSFDRKDNPNILCPDKQGTCPSKSTCCKLDSGKYGCCPLPNAVCCSDHVHCCPSGFTCDVAHQACNKGSLTVDWVQKLRDYEPVVTSVICPGGKMECPTGSTCCETKTGYGCCPVKEGVCCADKEHCCPKGYTCDTKHGRCNKKIGSGTLQWLDTITSTSRDKVSKSAKGTSRTPIAPSQEHKKGVTSKSTPKTKIPSNPKQQAGRSKPLGEKGNIDKPLQKQKNPKQKISTSKKTISNPKETTPKPFTATKQKITSGNIKPTFAKRPKTETDDLKQGQKQQQVKKSDTSKKDASKTDHQLKQQQSKTSSKQVEKKPKMADKVKGEPSKKTKVEIKQSKTKPVSDAAFSKPATVKTAQIRPKVSKTAKEETKTKSKPQEKPPVTKPKTTRTPKTSPKTSVKLSKTQTKANEPKLNVHSTKKMQKSTLAKSPKSAKQAKVSVPEIQKTADVTSRKTKTSTSTKPATATKPKTTQSKSKPPVQEKAHKPTTSKVKEKQSTVQKAKPAKTPKPKDMKIKTVAKDVKILPKAKHMAKVQAGKPPLTASKTIQKSQITPKPCGRKMPKKDVGKTQYLRISKQPSKKVTGHVPIKAKTAKVAKTVKQIQPSAKQVKTTTKRVKQQIKSVGFVPKVTGQQKAVKPNVQPKVAKVPVKSTKNLLKVPIKKGNVKPQTAQGTLESASVPKNVKVEQAKAVKQGVDTKSKKSETNEGGVFTKIYNKIAETTEQIRKTFSRSEKKSADDLQQQTRDQSKTKSTKQAKSQTATKNVKVETQNVKRKPVSKTASIPKQQVKVPKQVVQRGKFSLPKTQPTKTGTSNQAKPRTKSQIAAKPMISKEGKVTDRLVSKIPVKTVPKKLKVEPVKAGFPKVKSKARAGV